MLEAHTLTSESADLDKTLPTILALSNTVFNPETASKHTSEAVWRQRLSHPSSAIIYLSAPNTGNPVAFLFVHPRTHFPPLRTGETETLHVWLAGVLPEWRKAGCLAQMIDAISIRSTERMTICTVPTRFPDMWAWLTKRGWEVERETSEGRILLSKLVASQ